MNEILISIQPKYVRDIVHEIKTLEIRKTRPKCDLPCKVYVYCTKNTKQYFNDIKCCESWMMDSDDLGKVIGEFTLNKIDQYEEKDLFEGMDEISDSIVERRSRVWIDVLLKYKGDKEYLYGWNIDNFKRYDKSKELSEFGMLCMGESYWKCENCDYYYLESTEDGRYEECLCNNIKPLKKAPQDWCYVEEIKR